MGPSSATLVIAAPRAAVALDIHPLRALRRGQGSPRPAAPRCAQIAYETGELLHPRLDAFARHLYATFPDTTLLVTAHASTGLHVGHPGSPLSATVSARNDGQGVSVVRPPIDDPRNWRRFRVTDAAVRYAVRLADELRGRGTGG